MVGTGSECHLKSKYNEDKQKIIYAEEPAKRADS